MAKLKCVGGPRDGQYWEMPGHYKDIKIQNPHQITPSGSVVIYSPSISFTVYTRRMLCSMGKNGEKDEFQFLAPEGMSDMEAFRLQFSK